LQIFELLDMANEATEAPEWVRFYEAGLASYRARDFNAAIAAFEKVLGLRKEDRASTLMIERCKRALAAPAGEDWDDTAIALTK
jgi:adenylate cyclase